MRAQNNTHSKHGTHRITVHANRKTRREKIGLNFANSDRAKRKKDNSGWNTDTLNMHKYTHASFFFEIKNGVVSVHFKCLKFKNLFDKATKKIFPWLSLHAYKCASVCVCFMAGQIVNGQKIHRVRNGKK